MVFYIIVIVVMMLFMSFFIYYTLSEMNKHIKSILDLLLKIDENINEIEQNTHKKYTFKD